MTDGNSRQSAFTPEPGRHRCPPLTLSPSERVTSDIEGYYINPPLWLVEDVDASPACERPDESLLGGLLRQLHIAER